MDFMDAVVQVCLLKGWRVRYRTHPKTRANWDNEGGTGGSRWLEHRRKQMR